MFFLYVLVFFLCVSCVFSCVLVFFLCVSCVLFSFSCVFSCVFLAIYRVFPKLFMMCFLCFLLFSCDTETPPRLQAPVPSHPGIKYPVRESPHSDNEIIQIMYFAILNSEIMGIIFYYYLHLIAIPAQGAGDMQSPLT